MNVVDSSAWLEYFGDGATASDFAPAIEDPESLVVPTLTLFEVFKHACQIADESAALDAVAVMMQGTVVELTASIALDAARLSLESKLAMADAIILSTARRHEAVLWTLDAHFEAMEGVEYRSKR